MTTELKVLFVMELNPILHNVTILLTTTVIGKKVLGLSAVQVSLVILAYPFIC